MKGERWLFFHFLLCLFIKGVGMKRAARAWVLVYSTSIWYFATTHDGDGAMLFKFVTTSLRRPRE